MWQLFPIRHLLVLRWFHFFSHLKCSRQPIKKGIVIVTTYDSYLLILFTYSYLFLFLFTDIPIYLYYLFTYITIIMIPIYGQGN